MNIYEKLLNIQSELKAPKGQYNSFGKYKYRSCEDILEAVKPICKKYNAVLTLSDTLENIGDRYYIKATAMLTDIETEIPSFIINTAYAREEAEKKGMDGSQITGTASSYARKYALNGLFNIDDTKDADTDEYKQQQENGKITNAQLKVLQTLIKSMPEMDRMGYYQEILDDYDIKDLSQLKAKDFETIIKDIKNGG